MICETCGHPSDEHFLQDDSCCDCPHYKPTPDSRLERARAWKHEGTEMFCMCIACSARFADAEVSDALKAVADELEAEWDSIKTATDVSEDADDAIRCHIERLRGK